MERRDLLKYLVAGGVSAVWVHPLSAQQGAPRAQDVAGPPRVAANGGAARPDNSVIVTTPQEVMDVLREWEKKTAIIQRLRGTHQRYEYDDVFAVEKRAVGEFWHEAPDKGRIDFEPPKQLPTPAINTKKKTAAGQPFQVQSEEPQSWVCDGKSIIQVDHTPKTYGLAEIPLQHQGENIMDGPLPFLFGMKAEKIIHRYKLSLGSQHDKSGSDGRKKYHIVALPLMQSDARNWQRAEVILDAEYCLPSAIRLIDPAGSKETVYVFPLEGMKANEKFWLNDPFKMTLRGYKLVEKQTAPQGQPQGANRPIVPVNQARPAAGPPPR